MRWQYLVFFVAAFAGCRSAQPSQIDNFTIALSKDSQQVTVRGLDYAVLQDLKHDSLSQDGFEKILAVYRMPADTDMQDYPNEQPGTYHITDSLISFKPDTAFKKHQTYFARFYGGSTNNSITAMAQNKGNLKAPKFTEVVFKF